MAGTGYWLHRVTLHLFYPSSIISIIIIITRKKSWRGSTRWLDLSDELAIRFLGWYQYTKHEPILGVPIADVTQLLTVWNKQHGHLFITRRRKKRRKTPYCCRLLDLPAQGCAQGSRRKLIVIFKWPRDFSDPIGAYLRTLQTSYVWVSSADRLVWASFIRTVVLSRCLFIISSWLVLSPSP